MLGNYLKIAFRNLLKYRFISFINLFGLTLGLTCCLLILVYITNELSYDRYNKNADNIYRVTRLFRNATTGSTTLNLSTISPPFGPYLTNDFKEIKKMTRLLDFSPLPIRYGEKKFNEQNVYFADENFFDVFDIRMVKGNPAKALTDPFTVMLTEETASKYFGAEDPMDKVIRVNNKFDLKVTGIYKSFPSNTHMHPGMMVSFNTLKDTAVYGEENLRTNWGNNSFFTYLLMPPHFDPKKMEARFPAFLDEHMPGYGSKNKASAGTALSLQKLTDIHLRSHTDYEAEENGDIKRVYIFSAIALFILLIACINYMNLSTARSALRAKEIGIRKTVGAERKGIIFQFLSESVLISLIAMAFAVLLTWSALPLLNKLTGQQLNLSSIVNFKMILLVCLVPFVIGLLSGLYPALFMSSFNPVKVLKGMVKVGGGNISFRQVLVTAQFAISIILIISTAVVFNQLNYIQKKSLGYDRDHIVTLTNDGGLAGRFEAFRNDLLSNSNIKNVARSSRIPTGRLLDAQGTQINRGDSLVPVNADIKFINADEAFLSTYGVKIAAGRDFSKDFGTDTSSFLINEASVQAMGFKENNEALGKDIAYGGRKGKIIGVIRDFHFESMHQRIVPLIIQESIGGNYRRLSVKIAGNNLPAAIAQIENVWRKFLPETPFEYSFLDERFARLYESEQKQATIFTIFAFIAILIACLGLLGLSAFAITQRIKEIGIRKVLGASVSGIVTLLSKDFLKLVLIAAVIAFPIAWYAMNNWLQDFAYRTSIPWWLFLVAGVLAGIVALATVSFQAIKAAVANPVKSLRSE